MKPQELDAYVYDVLPSPNHIRLLSIHFSNDQNSFYIELLSSDLNHCPSFEALSYTWGDGGLGSSVICNGNKIMVTSNCVDALRHLQHRHSRHFWIDAVCINQSSLTEKAVQIPLMGQIYGCAKQVVVWLGNPTPSSDRALYYLNEIIYRFSDMPESLRTMSMAGRLDEDAIDMIRSVRSQLQEENKKTYGHEGTAQSNILSDIFLRPWFSRLWTLQELVMANNEAVFVCGTMELLWGHLVLALTALVAFEQFHSTSSIVADNETKFYDQIQVYRSLRIYLHDHLQSQVQIAGLKEACKQRSTLGDVMMKARHLQSSDPRDKMYGLHAYLQARGLTNLPVLSYAQSTAEVCARYTQSIMLHDQSLELFAGLGERKRLADLPSWCPDWSVNTKTARIHVSRFKAAGSSVAQIRFCDKRLLLRGIVVDTIKGRAESHMPSTNEFANQKVDIAEGIANIRQRIQTWQEWIRIVCGRHRKDGFVSIPAINDFCNVILQEGIIGPLPFQRIDSDILGQAKELMVILLIFDLHPQVGPDLLKVFDHWVDLAIARPAVASLYWTNKDERDKITRIPEWRILMALNYGAAARLQRWTFALTHDQTIFTTDQDRLGIAADSICAGDQVVLLEGLNAPVIVRPVEHGCYQLVSLAYVESMMYGEQWQSDESSLQNFEFV
ncbi:hypothetical protein LTS08_008331 [Lithohypha guttulata]|nr:hypothetical protein LTS08_008331 [Lithohypha guttulata]